MTHRGIPLHEIYHETSPWNVSTLPILVCSFHTILYKLNPSLKDPPEPHTPAHKYHWDEGYVRMPYSPKNMFPSKNHNGKEELVSRWELIKRTLMQDIDSSRAFEAAVNAYNSRVPKFHALHHLFEDVFDEQETKHFFSKLLPKIVHLALELPDIVTGSIPLLNADHCRSVSLSQKQIACLLANAFLCTFPGRKNLAHNYPTINFISLFASSKNNSVIEKLKCIIHYFRRVLQKMPVGVITFERQHVNRNHLPRWDKLDNNLGNVRIHLNSEGTIEDDGLGLLQVDFANKFLGGGVLGYGCVQEEIRFVINPELIVTRLFTEKLGNSESLIITGVERFSMYKGYGDSFEWNGNYVDETPYDDYGRRRTQIVAIDATHYSRTMDQFNSGAILRELNKAYSGFHTRATGTLPAVATGNWGCGAFGGNVYLKFFIQLMAASASRRSIVYYTFGSNTLCDELYNMYTFLANNQISVSQLWRLICKFISAEQKADKFFPFIQQAFFDSKKQPSIKAAFSHLHESLQKRSIEPSVATTSNNSSEGSKAEASENNSNMEWNENAIESGNDSTPEDPLPTQTNSSQILKRKRKTSSNNSLDLLSLINKIDGSSTSNETESSHNTSLGFLDCVDEYTKQQRAESGKNSNGDNAQCSDNEEMDVEEILESLTTERAKTNGSNLTPKRKITDYFKKP